LHFRRIKILSDYQAIDDVLLIIMTTCVNSCPSNVPVVVDVENTCALFWVKKEKKRISQEATREKTHVASEKMIESLLYLAEAKSSIDLAYNASALLPHRR
jgi:peptide subunit release factor RF-3